MFNIKNIVNKITDRGRESHPNSPGRAGQEEEDGLNNLRTEGFLCPKCMKALASPSELQVHYESHHAEDTGSHDIQGASGAGFYSLHQEVGERYKQQQDLNSSNSDLAKYVSLVTDTHDLQKLLREALESRNILQNDKEHLEQRAAQLAQLNATLKAACDEGESSQIALKERLKVVEAQLAHRESIDDAAVLRQELVQVQRVMDELNREREKERDALQAELQLLQSDRSHETLTGVNEKIKQKELEISKLTEELKLAKEECIELNAKYEEGECSKSKEAGDKIVELQHEIASLTEESAKTIESLKNDLNKVSEEKETLKTSLQNLQQYSDNYKASSVQNLENIMMQLELITIRNEENESKLKGMKEEINILCKQKDDLRNQILENQQELKKQQQENIEKENKIEELNLGLIQSKEKIVQLENEHSELVAQIQAGEGATTAIQQLTQENSSLQVKLRDEMNLSSKNKEEYLRSVQALKNQVVQKEKETQQAELKLENERTVLNNVRTELKAVSDNLRSVQEQLSGKEAALEEMNTSNQTLKKSLDQSKEKYSEVKKALSEEKSLVSGLSEKFKKSQEQLTETQKEIDILHQAKGKLSHDLQKNESLVEQLKTELKTTNESKQTLEKNIVEFQEMKRKLEEELLNVKTENSKLLEDIASLEELVKTIENQLQVIGVQRASLETSLFEAQKSIAELENDKKDFEEEKKREISGLRDVLKTKTESLEKQEEAVKILMGERVSLNEQLEALRMNHKAEINAASEKYNLLQIELNTCSQAKEILEKDLTREIEKKKNLEDELEKQSATLEATVKESNEKEKSLQVTLDEITGEKLALEVQLDASQTEQQALLERCFASTSETEILHRTIADLRRKLDESQAGLHELGRENQTLQLDIEKLIGRKWAEDSEVNQCTLCHRDFTMVIRKHHCRNCGQIFCRECSSKSAPIASNKKPVRVCDSCFSELTPK